MPHQGCMHPCMQWSSHLLYKNWVGKPPSVRLERRIDCTARQGRVIPLGLKYCFSWSIDCILLWRMYNANIAELRTKCESNKTSERKTTAARVWGLSSCCCSLAFTRDTMRVVCWRRHDDTLAASQDIVCSSSNTLWRSEWVQASRRPVATRWELLLYRADCRPCSHPQLLRVPCCWRQLLLRHSHALSIRSYIALSGTLHFTINSALRAAGTYSWPSVGAFLLQLMA